MGLCQLIRLVVSASTHALCFVLCAFVRQQAPLVHADPFMHEGCWVAAPGECGPDPVSSDECCRGNIRQIIFAARFGAHLGNYMMHCHNIVHEDKDMLRAFLVRRYLLPTSCASAPSSDIDPSWGGPLTAHSLRVTSEHYQRCAANIWSTLKN